MNGYSQNYFSEDFNDSIPATWSTVSSGTTPDPWFATDENSYGNAQTLDGTILIRVEPVENNVYYNESIESPGFTVSSGGNIITLSFNQRYYQPSNGTSKGYIEVYNGTEWDTAYVQNSSIGGWYESSYDTDEVTYIDITNYYNTTGETKVRFSLDTDMDEYPGYWAIDNVDVSSFNCLPPAHSTITEGAVQAIIEWDSSVDGITTLIYGEVDFDPETQGTSIANLSSPYNLTGLEIDTDYEYYLQNDCGAVDSLSTLDGPYDMYTTQACPTPYMGSPYGTDLTTNSALIDYSEYGIGEYNLIWGPEGYNPLTEGDTIFNISNPYLLEGLDDSTSYTIRLYMDCDGDGLGVSGISGPRNFTTLNPCPDPVIPYDGVFDITTTSAMLEYTTNGPGTVYMIIGAEGFIPTNEGDTIELTSNPFLIDGLDPLSFYDIYLYMNCEAASDGISMADGPETFNTLTDALGTSCDEPFVLNGNLPYESIEQSICGYGDNVVGYDGCSHGGGNEEIVYVFSPEADSVVLGFYVTNATVSTIYYTVSTLCASDEEAECIIEEQWSTSSNPTYLVTTDIGQLNNGETYYITVSGNTYNGCDLDLKLFLIDCTTPTQLDYVNYADSTVLTWSFSNEYLTEWQLTWGPEGFDFTDPDAGTTISGDYLNGLESATATITGLSDTTSYEFYVRDLCGPNDYSVPAGPISFVGPPPANDLCVNAISLECNETVTGSNITANNEGNSTGSCPNTSSFPQGPTVWYTFVGTGYETVLNTCGTGWNTAIWVYSGECNSLECVDYSSGNYYLGESQCTGSSDSYLSFQSELNVTYTVAIAAGTTYNPPTGEFYLSMECIPCSAPYDLELVTVSNEAAMFSWNSFNSGANYTYGYNISGSSDDDIIGTDVIPEGEAPIVAGITINGLVANTLYDFYIIEECTAGNSDTLWIEFTTNEFAPPVNDLCSNAILLECTGVDTTMTTYATSFGNPEGNQCNGNYDMFNRTVWWQFVGTGEELNISSCGSYKSSNFSYMWTRIFVMTGDCDSLECVGVGTQQDPDCNMSGSNTVSIYGEVGVTYYIGIMPTSNYNNNDIGGLVINLECIDCSTPTNIEDVHTNTSAQISWDSFNQNADYTLIYDTAGFDYPTEPGIVVTGVNNNLPVLLEGLEQDGSYDVYLFEYCTSTSSNTDTLEYEFTTYPEPAPLNDNICNAIEVFANDTLETTTKYGSIEMNEPMPPITGCNEQDGWCNEDLTSTSWYTFTPTMDGYATISTCYPNVYFGSQLAIYTMDDCDGFANWELVAANENVDSDENCGGSWNSSLIKKCLEAGVTYYIQVDPYNYYSDPTGDDFVLTLTFEGAEAITNGVFPSPHTATVVWNYNGDVSNNVDYTLYYTNTITEVEYSVTGNSADNPTLLEGLDSETLYTYYIVCNDQCNTTTSMESFTTLLDGINELGFGRNVKVYPNPVSDQLTIEINTDVNEGSVISIISMQGQIIYSETVSENASDYRTDINVNDYANGIYLLKLEDENSSIQQRIIVQ